MNLRMQRLCVWCGPGLILIFMIGFLFVAGLVPPPSPNLGASEVARFYTEHQTRIQIGLIISMIGSGLAFPWAAVISVQMRRIGRSGRLSQPHSSPLVESCACSSCSRCSPCPRRRTGRRTARPRSPRPSTTSAGFPWSALWPRR